MSMSFTLTSAVFSESLPLPDERAEDTETEESLVTVAYVPEELTQRPPPATKSRSHGTAKMDNTAEDSVVMIHPPFTSFPQSHLYPNGLTFALMGDHSDWFLDANDFVRTEEGQQEVEGLLTYPSALEPPRGWCPKRKDLKARGAVEGEEPRLRCTFCRRTYAGVNAKSMWRRHVFEKHKIAMSNRREGNDRSRGRGSNKENKTKARAVAPDQEIDSGPSSQEPSPPAPVLPHEEEVVEVYGPQASSSKLRKVRPAAPEGRKRNRRAMLAEGDDDVQQLAPSPMDVEPHPLSKLALSELDEAPLSLTNAAGEIVLNLSDARSLPPPTPPPRFSIPESPYDPLLTPSFRHSTPRVPSNQPWRFPSPSHPLHSKAHEFSLTMLSRGNGHPNGSSPASHGRGTPGSSPGGFLSFGLKKSADTPFGWDRSLSMSSMGFPASSPFNKTPFRKGRSISFDTPNKRSGMSPPQSSLRGRYQVHVRSSSDLPDEWMSDASGSGAMDLDSSSLFNSSFGSWGDTSASSATSISSPAANDSPVVRSSQGLTAVGQGIGLLQPFMIDKKRLAPASGSDECDTFGPPKRGIEQLSEDSEDDDDATMGTDSDEEAPRKRRRLSA